MIKRRLELRTIVEKGLEERRNDLIADMEAIVNKADEETRALSTEEVEKYNNLSEKELDKILNKSLIEVTYLPINTYT